MIAMLTMPSPLGTLRLYATREELSGVYLPDQVAPAAVECASDVLRAASAQLAEYFGGTRRVFELPLGPVGSGFQQRVWRALAAIPFGDTCSYGAIARTIGRPSASRAVGAANGKNPISIVVPCHRVLAASGELTGYAGGLVAKRWLLDHERRCASTVESREPSSAARDIQS